MSATDVGGPRPGGTGRTWLRTALSPVLWGAGLATAAVGLATTAHAAGFGVTPPALGGGAAPATRCAPSAGLDVTPVLVATPAEAVPYRVTAVSVSGVTGCTGATLSVTVRSATDAAVRQVSAVVPPGTAPVVVALPAPLVPTEWYGWSATVDVP